MTLVDILHFGACLANVIKIHRFASLVPRSEHLLNDIIQLLTNEALDMM